MKTSVRRESRTFVKVDELSQVGTVARSRLDRLRAPTCSYRVFRKTTGSSKPHGHAASRSNVSMSPPRLWMLRDVMRRLVLISQGSEKRIETHGASLGPLSASPVVSVTAQRVPCRPWCVRYDHAEGYCHSRNVSTPGGQWSASGYVAMSHGSAGGTLVELHHDSDAELTPNEAEQYAYAVLTQVALARAVHRSQIQP